MSRWSAGMRGGRSPAAQGALTFPAVTIRWQLTNFYFARLRLSSGTGDAGFWQPDKMGDYLINGTTNDRVFYRSTFFFWILLSWSNASDNFQWQRLNYTRNKCSITMLIMIK